MLKRAMYLSCLCSHTEPLTPMDGCVKPGCVRSVCADPTTAVFSYCGEAIL